MTWEILGVEDGGDGKRCDCFEWWRGRSDRQLRVHLASNLEWQRRERPIGEGGGISIASSLQRLSEAGAPSDDNRWLLSSNESGEHRAQGSTSADD